MLQSLWASPSDRRSVLGIVSFWYAILYLIPTGRLSGGSAAVWFELAAAAVCWTHVSMMARWRDI